MAGRTAAIGRNAVPAESARRTGHRARAPESIAQRTVKLLRSIAAESPVMLTGGMARDVGLRAAVERRIAEDGSAPLTILTDAQSPHAGAIGAGLWAAVRHQRLGRPLSATA